MENIYSDKNYAWISTFFFCSSMNLSLNSIPHEVFEGLSYLSLRALWTHMWLSAASSPPCSVETDSILFFFLWNVLTEVVVHYYILETLLPIFPSPHVINREQFISLIITE